jgi:hypothetical protein
MVRDFTNQLTPQTTPNQLLLNLHAFQKLNYLHNNPIAEHWQLVNDPCMFYIQLVSTMKLEKIIILL